MKLHIGRQYRPRHRRNRLRQLAVSRVVALAALAGSAVIAPASTGAAHADSAPLQIPLSGTVIDPGDVPAQAAIVDAYALNPSNPASIAMHLGRTATDESGHFSLAVPLHAGMATLAAQNGGVLNVLVVVEDLASGPLQAYQTAFVASYSLSQPADLCPASSVPSIPVPSVINQGQVPVGLSTVDDAMTLVTAFINAVLAMPWGQECNAVMNDAAAAEGIALEAVTVLSGEGPSVPAVTSSGDGVVRYLSSIPTWGTSVTGFGAVTGMDQDYLAGHDNLDDPTLIPPFGARLIQEEWADSPNDVTGPVTGAVQPTIQLDAMPYGPSESTGCSINSTHLYPKDGGGPDDYNVKYQATYAIYKCDDTDRYNDYYIVYWKGSIKAGDDQQWLIDIWRYKFRTQLTKSNFAAFEPDPLKDSQPSNGTTVNYSVGFGGSGVGGSFTFRSGSKIHPWYDYDNQALYHVSWMASDKYGDCCGPFFTGGAFKLRVPQAAAGVSSGLKSGLQIWQCYDNTWDDNGTQNWHCDPH